MMKRLRIIFTLLAIQILIAEKTFSFHPIINLGFIPYTQGGILDFSSPTADILNPPSQNSDTVVLRNYTGLPLKALQFKIVFGKDEGKLIFRSISRGSSIPDSSFLLDYEVYKGEPRPDGSSIDIVSVVLLGWGENVLLPRDLHQIISINYDIVGVNDDGSITHLRLYDVIGATCTPVQDANILAGEIKTIYLSRLSFVNNKEITLLQNYPNPFNPFTTINFSVANDEHVSLKIFNSLAQEIATLVDEYKTTGNYSINFDAGNLTSGVYLYQIKVGNYTTVKKMMLVK
ncbi:MAG: hypothetical protein A2V93_05625 [Ignavibacteria bacterium RBG_16_34_14]|nr:MAG: hypothetical protein A2V93_05625 [Ignavibacteria bacterium RBG_16_34_14]